MKPKQSTWGTMAKDVLFVLKGMYILKDGGKPEQFEIVNADKHDQSAEVANKDY